jgi:hypothetical protein
MKYAVVFLIFGLTCAFYAFAVEPLFFKFLTAAFAISFISVGLAYAFIGPHAFLKKPDGRLSVLSYVLYWPYLVINWLLLAAFRHGKRENAFDLIAPNVYLGCRLSPRDEADITKLGIASVLDLTCEFSEIQKLRSLPYLCIPLLDTTAPSVEQLEAGAKWIQEQSERGPVYVHCALGHGRSATFVAAYLLRSNQTQAVHEAIELIKRFRPRIGLHPPQIAILKTHLIAHKKEGFPDLKSM